MSDERDLVPLPELPMIPIDELKKLTVYVNEVKKTLMIKGKDYIVDWDGRQYTCRSGFAKLAQGFTLSDGKPEIIKILYDEPKEFIFTHYLKKKPIKRTIMTRVYGFEARVKVINLQSGRFAHGEGACTVEELHQTNNMDPKWYHRCLGTAKTRAWNRAVSNYVGSADISAEEMGLRYTDEGAGDPSRKVVDSMQETQLSTPSWSILESLKSEGWGNVDTIVTTWLGNSGIDPRWVSVESDIVKVSVKPLDILYSHFSAEDLDGHMAEAGFTKSQGAWRLNKPEDL